MSGIPTPDEVEEWWRNRSMSPDGSGIPDHADHGSDTSHDGHIYGENGDWLLDGISLEANVLDCDREAIEGHPIIENGSDNGNSHDREQVIGAIRDTTAISTNGERIREFLEDPPQWFRKQAAVCVREGRPKRLLNPLASDVAHECLGDARRWWEVQSAIEKKLKELV